MTTTTDLRDALLATLTDWADDADCGSLDFTTGEAPEHSSFCLARMARVTERLDAYAAAAKAEGRAEERRLIESAYDEAAEAIHAAFCDPDQQVGPWDREMAGALRRRGFVITTAEPRP